MTDDTLTSVDTITIAALLRALQVVITAYNAEHADPAALQALEQRTIAEIKALDTGDFTYEEQAEGLAEGLIYARAMFRYALANPGRPSLPSDGQPAALDVSADQPLLQHHRN
ncbi:hypothetical protein GCM10007036_46880 [Alsobacter metallidurans]|uniref:Uncharacterized protein n=1 Tax=Alsobacter metallidurans TaxID=340221 RepID=A0A917IBR4_9HYPH|nr:hypothetical protein [Alsobacter metallidurans]GGH33874.1 hypothetical protein GCM10007036_46880 [Alsobacter metallidurans]